MNYCTIILLYCFMATNLIVFCKDISETKDKPYKTNSTNNESYGVKSKAKENRNVIDEGGPVLANISPVFSPKVDDTILMTLDKELGPMKVRPIKPRKEAKLTSSEESKSNESKPLEENNTQDFKNKENITSIKSKENINNTSNVTAKINLNKIVTHKKPRILSYEVLSSLDNFSNVESYPKSYDKKKSPMYSYGQPKLIVPIMTSMLVLPLFVVLAIMGLRKGKEAWKNRHYKRVDFLLDGMYKD